MEYQNLVENMDNEVICDYEVSLKMKKICYYILRWCIILVILPITRVGLKIH